MENLTFTWTSLFTAAISGGAVAKIADHLVSWIGRLRKERKSAKSVVDAHLDPLLKAADAISGKTISLAERDFIPLSGRDDAATHSLDPDLIGLTYLYANFWSRIEILERESLGISLSVDKRGRKLSKFIACLGSKQIRLVNRTHQKAIGEIASQVLSTGGLRTIGVVEFGEIITSNESAKKWCAPLTQLLSDTTTKATRQKLLVYGVVLHALVDTLDPTHLSTHERPSYPNKLSNESKRRVKHLIFGEYLKGIDAHNNYT
ncbi:hypothetical protein HEP74_03730 [Xanthomonas sp. SS]|uniref:hypothetical protein n=1 Tax=Xanthomonas sp. SS TaxID=2724122 RepID=UPI00163ADC3E|nr:hypothetical protein [Xanthomonas sp. SS]QNH18558.1 hypothetical protein HEP74_03730 [Xanthomonas sp. SS]